MEINNRKSVFEKLSVFSPYSNDESDYIEVTEWANGEGYDITIQCKYETKSFSLHIDELEAINYLTRALMYKK